MTKNVYRCIIFIYKQYITEEKINMPYIEAKFSKKLTDVEIAELKSGFGKAIECIPGKSESWLMVNIEDAKNIFFKGGNSEDSAYVSISTFGKAPSSAFEKMTGELCGIISDKTGISPSRIYITYHEISNWGWNGSNF